MKPSIPTSAVNKLFNSVCSMENKQLSGRQVDGSLFKFSYTFYIELINVMTPPSTFSSSLSLSLSLSECIEVARLPVIPAVSASQKVTCVC